MPQRFLVAYLRIGSFSVSPSRHGCTREDAKYGNQGIVRWSYEAIAECDSRFSNA